MPAPKKTISSLDNDVLFTIHGMEIRKNSLYEINSKFDSDAPDGFQKESTTKLLNEAVVDIEPAASWNQRLGSWDTGLTESSDFLKECFKDESERKVILARVNEYIVKPYEERVGKGALRHTSDNNQFWDNYAIRIGNYRVFNTEKVEELYQLFILLLKKRVTPKAMEKHPAWKNSSYIVVDKEEIISREEERDLKLINAYSAFTQLLTSSDLADVLDWVGVRVQDTSTSTVKYSQFKKFVDNPEGNYKNLSDFKEAIDMYSKENEKEIFTIHKHLKELYRKNKGVTIRRSEVFLDEEVLGNNFKVAARKVHKDKNLHSKLIELI